MKSILASLPLLLAVGCASNDVNVKGWLPNLPPRTYYETIYASDPDNAKIQTREDYFKWVAAFYTGIPLITGWDRREEELLENLDADMKELVKLRFELLGQILSSEWAKENVRRRIANETLINWGGALIEARDAKRLLPVLEAILLDAQAILAKGFDPGEITSERYEEKQP